MLFQGILTKDVDGKVANSTTCKDSYRKYDTNGVRQKGVRLERLEKKLYEKVRYGSKLVF